MKIAFIKKKIPLPSANVINAINHAKAYYNLGNKVDILTINEFSKEDWILKKKNAHKFYNLNQNIKIRYFKGSFLFYLRNFKPFRGILNLLRNIEFIYDYLDPEISISKYCIKNKYDLAHCRNSFRAAYYNITNEIPTIIESHHYKIPEELKKLKILSKSKYFLGILTISDFLKQNFIKHGFPSKKIIVLEDAVNLNAFDNILSDKSVIRKELNLPLDKKLIMYVGSIYENRGIATILSAANLLNNKLFSFRFIGGNKKYIKKWEKFISKNSINADVKFLGYKSHGIIPFYLKAADILLATFTLDVPTLKWMSPIKLFEFMGSKVPFITTKIGRTIEICNNNECLFTNPEDNKDLSEKIERLIGDKDLQNNLVNKSYQKAKENTYEKRCQKILDFIIKQSEISL